MPVTNKFAMSRRGFLSLAGASLLAASVGCQSDSSGAYPNRPIRIMAPAGTGGGWDLTARAIQEALTSAKIVGNQSVKAYNVEGSGGTVGLTQLVNRDTGNPHELMVTGHVMVGAERVYQSRITLSNITPIATLTIEPEVVVVPADSPYENLRGLIEASRENPDDVNWGGGSAGGTDQILVGMLSKAYGSEPVAMKYMPYSGGGESRAALLSGDLHAGVSSVSEYADLVASGDLRVLGVSSAEGVDAGAGTIAPTMKEQEFDIELMNWRGLVAPPGISDEDKNAITSLVEELHQAEQWKTICKKMGWADFYKTGAEAEKFFKSEQKAMIETLSSIGFSE